MTKIKCEYKNYPYHKPDEDPGYCKHRGVDGICTLKTINVGEADCGWVATCKELKKYE